MEQSQNSIVGIKKLYANSLKIVEFAEKEKWSKEELVRTIELLHLHNNDYFLELSKEDSRL